MAHMLCAGKLGGGYGRTHARLIVVWVVRELSATYIYTGISIANYDVGVEQAAIVTPFSWVYYTRVVNEAVVLIYYTCVVNV